MKTDKDSRDDCSEYKRMMIKEWNRGNRRRRMKREELKKRKRIGGSRNDDGK